jgi:hypothetical protein
MGLDESQDQQRGKAIFIPTPERSEGQGGQFDTSLFTSKKKTEVMAQNPRQDIAWCARHLDLFIIQTVQRPTHCEWGSSLYDSKEGGPSHTRL